MPLPEKVPKPETDVFHEELVTKLKRMGITWDEECKEEFVTYTLPVGWKMSDVSKVECAPVFCIVDNTNKVRCKVYGTWSGNYENWLRWSIPDTLEEFVVPQKPLAASEVSKAAVVGTLLQTLDTQHRPPRSREVKRKPDFVTSANHGKKIVVHHKRPSEIEE